MGTDVPGCWNLNCAGPHGAGEQPLSSLPGGNNLISSNLPAGNRVILKLTAGRRLISLKRCETCSVTVSRTAKVLDDALSSRPPPSLHRDVAGSTTNVERGWGSGNHYNGEIHNHAPCGPGLTPKCTLHTGALPDYPALYRGFSAPPRILTFPRRRVSSCQKPCATSCVYFVYVR